MFTCVKLQTDWNLVKINWHIGEVEREVKEHCHSKEKYSSQESRYEGNSKMS